MNESLGEKNVSLSSTQAHSFKRIIPFWWRSTEKNQVLILRLTKIKASNMKTGLPDDPDEMEPNLLFISFFIDREKSDQ